MAADTPRLAIARSLGLLQAGTGRGMATPSSPGAPQSQKQQEPPVAGACGFTSCRRSSITACNYML